MCACVRVLCVCVTTWEHDRVFREAHAERLRRCSRAQSISRTYTSPARKQCTGGGQDIDPAHSSQQRHPLVAQLSSAPHRLAIPLPKCLQFQLREDLSRSGSRSLGLASSRVLADDRGEANRTEPVAWDAGVLDPLIIIPRRWAVGVCCARLALDVVLLAIFTIIYKCNIKVLN